MSVGSLDERSQSFVFVVDTIPEGEGPVKEVQLRGMEDVARVSRK